MKQNGKLKKYLVLNQKYLSDIDALLKSKDYVQASEKLWGATATLAKAIAASRGKQIKPHDGVTFFLTSVANELRDKSILRVILIADGLHQNFYENTLTPEAVKEGARLIKQFSKRMCNTFKLVEQ